MPLQSSGPISLLDIANEFGGTVPHNINEYYRGGLYVPNTSVNINIPTIGLISFANFYGSSKLRGFVITANGGGTTNDQAYAIAFDSSGNFYMTGETNAPGTRKLVLAKFNSAGSIQWHRFFGTNVFGLDYGNGVSVDSSSNVYVCGSTTSQTVGGFDALLIKYNTFGTIQWQKTLGGAGTDLFNQVSLDSSANCYAVGYINADNMLIAKYNTNGVLQWQTGFNLLNLDVAYSVVSDASGNFYVTGSTNSSSSIYIIKYNTSGVIQWQRSLNGTGFEYGADIAIDPSSNVYISGSTTSTGVSGGNDMYIAKYNTNGLLQWQRYLGGTGTESANGICVDNSGNVYVCGTNTTSPLDGIIAKYNTNGVLQWQRYLGTTGTERLSRIRLDSTQTNILVCGTTTSTNNDMFIVRLPTDGTPIGTLALGFSYSTATLTDAAGSLTDSAGVGSAVAPFATDASRTISEVAGTLVFVGPNTF